MKVIFVCFRCRTVMDTVKFKVIVVHACPLCDREVLVTIRRKL